MDSVKIKALLRAAELGSLTKAAEELGYTQAGLTHMMNRLEAEVGFELLLRNKNGVKLTPEGEKLLPYLKDFSIAHEQLKRAVDETSRGLGEIVRIGTYTSILKLWLPTVINGFKKISPEIRIEIHDLGINAMYDRVSISEIDLAFGYNVIYGITEKHRHIELECHGHRGKNNPRKKKCAVFRDESHQLYKGAFTFAGGLFFSRQIIFFHKIIPPFQFAFAYCARSSGNCEK